jgi:hypothetical protein
MRGHVIRSDAFWRRVGSVRRQSQSRLILRQRAPFLKYLSRSINMRPAAPRYHSNLRPPPSPRVRKAKGPPSGTLMASRHIVATRMPE